MTVTVSWYDSSHRILCYRFIGEWTWEEYYPVLAEGRLMEKEADHYVCTINDMRQMGMLPANFIEQVRSISLTRPTTTAIAVYISTNYHFVSIYEVIVRLFPDTSTLYPLVKTEAEALALIDGWFKTHPQSVSTSDQDYSTAPADNPKN